ncbi:MAG: EsaB/YukD family protein [Micrococcales bacterium]|nr:EsaB/YukD family protein [Micrococcales bacterium]MCL2666976.1 EsaB/YukD family protein [Micrococcales bacterium]
MKLTAQRAVVHVTITAEGRQVDTSVPAQVPLVELLPGIVNELGALSPSRVHTGFTLSRSDGTHLDPTNTCAAQHVADGTVLVLVAGGLVAERRRYDDIVEAVIDATADQPRWTPRDHAHTAVAVSLTLLALGAGLLAAGGHASVAVGTAAVLVATAAVLTRVAQPVAGHSLGLAGAAYAAVGAYLLAPAGSLWAWPLAAAGAGLVVVGTVALVAVAGPGRQVHLVPVGLGATLGTAAAVAAVTMHDGSVPTAPYVVLVALLGAVANLLPWIAASSTRIAVVSPQSDDEILATPTPVDGADVARRTAHGHAVALACRTGLGLAVLVTTPVVAGANVAGVALCTLVFAGMMFESRLVYARSQVAVLMGVATAGVALTGTVAAVSATVPLTWLTGVLLGTAVVLVTLTMLSPSAHLRLVRVYDTVEALCLAALLPLGAFAAGLV